MSFSENLLRVRERISRAAERAARSESDITIVAVAKTFGPERVEEAIRGGLVDIGENRVQEFLEKADGVALPCRWHLVGHLQTNKVSKAVGRFALIQSIDSMRLAERLSRAGGERAITTDILVEINTSGEGSKYGFAPGEAVEACERITRLPAVRIQGLMTVGPLVEDAGAVASAFARLRTLKEDIERTCTGDTAMRHLSMGMTDDFEIAIAEGSTMVRLGRILFGERPLTRK
jgi:pyridoxal phosphate enzyme (YggS family)